PSYTVTGSGGGGTHMYHWKEPRALTHRERARLQTYPDNFQFLKSHPSVYRQNVMTVPPHDATLVIEAMLLTLEGEDYSGIDAPNVDVTELISAYERSEQASVGRGIEYIDADRADASAKPIPIDFDHAAHHIVRSPATARTERAAPMHGEAHVPN